MKRIIGEIFKRPNGWLSTMFYCIGESGEVDRAITDTLLELIEQSCPHEDELEKLVELAETGCYVSPDPTLPDWGANDINIWLVPPMAKPGCVCISNENAGDFAADGGEPQQFAYSEFRLALKHWREFKELIVKEGKEKLVGQQYEVQLN